MNDRLDREGNRTEERHSYSDNGCLAGVKQTDLLVFAGGEDLCAISVPAGAVDEVRVLGVHPHHCLPTGHIPQDHHIITGWIQWRRCGQQKIQGQAYIRYITLKDLTI